MIIDDILGYLCLKRISTEWTESSELEKILAKFDLGQERTREILSFLEKYFLESDSIRHKVRVLDSVSSLFLN
ncbi:MAG: hypothetical protein QG670_594 [Thermoproteota archaeon]|nr:hypothetical protein [Thermoproteota archaeon]